MDPINRQVHGMINIIFSEERGERKSAQTERCHSLSVACTRVTVTRLRFLLSRFFFFSVSPGFSSLCKRGGTRDAEKYK